MSSKQTYPIYFKREIMTLDPKKKKPACDEASLISNVVETPKSIYVLKNKWKCLFLACTISMILINAIQLKISCVSYVGQKTYLRK